MHSRRDNGATLAFVAATALLLVLVAIAFFFYQMIVGGGTELQRATDAGNLNVARRALRSPGIRLAGNDLNEFGNLTDTNGQVNLATFNRLVAKSVLVSLNAQSARTPQSEANARALAAMIEGENGIGRRLSSELSSHGNVKSFFQQITTQHSLRMLGNSGTSDVSGETQTAFMKRRAASNVFINPQQMPPGSNFANDDRSVARVNGVRYLRGYVPLNTGNNVPNPVAVPLRPGEQPHGVSLDDFHSEQSQSPVLGSRQSPRIPPNAFRSGGAAREALQSNSNITTRACAIVGSLNVQYQAEIPRGFILIDNQGSLSGPVQYLPSPPGRAPDMYVALMNIVNVAQSNGRTYISENADYQDLRNRIAEASGPDMQSARERAATQWLNSGNYIDSPTSFTAQQLVTDFGPGSNPTIFDCNNLPSGSAGSIDDPPCKQLRELMNSVYTPSNRPPAEVVDKLMAIERFKALVLEIRAGLGFDMVTCRTARANWPCTGLKSYNLNIRSTPSLNPFGNPNPTLRQLWNQTNASNTIIEQELVSRLYQIQPRSTAAEIQAILNSTVPFGESRIIYRHPGTDRLVVRPVSNYPWPIPQNIDFENPNSVFPDGPLPSQQNGRLRTRRAQVEGFKHGGGLINIPNEGGYPMPWDCPPGAGAVTEDRTEWRPHSGFGNLLGIIRFRNCASGGGQWCCPC